jgi:hypothetical protein
MKTKPKELKEWESSTETLINCLRALSRTVKSDGLTNAALAEAAYRMEEMRGLIDGAYDMVEIHGGGSPSREKWRKKWMDRARACGAVPSL